MSGAAKKPVLRKKKYFITTVDKTLHRSRNSSLMTKKSLQSNNRALAKCLSQQKRENRNLTVDLTSLIAERFVLNQRIKRLENEREIILKEMWNPSNLEKVKKLKTILNQVSGNVLVTAQLINSVVDLFQDVDVNPCRTSEAERTSCMSIEDRQIESNPLNQLIVNTEPAANTNQSNDGVVDLEAQKLNEANDAHKSPCHGPKAMFDLSAISEQSELESRRSSVQSRLSIINHRRTKSNGRFEMARQRRSRGFSTGSENDLCMNTPRSVDTLEKIPRDILTDLSEKEDRCSLLSQSGDGIEANKFSPFVKMIRIDEPVEVSRRGTFVVTSSLQTAAWPPDDAFVSTRKSSKSSGKKKSDEEENKLPPLKTAPSELNQLTNYDISDMELTEVLQVSVELGKQLENPKTLKTRGPKSRTTSKREKKLTNQSKQRNLEPFVVLEDVQRRSNLGITTPGSSTSTETDRYDVVNVSKEATDPREKFSTWKSKRCSGTDEELNRKSSPLEKIEVLNINQTSIKRASKSKKTPKRKIQNEKENFEVVSERPRRARNCVDYKLPSLTAKIRRDNDGNVVISKRVSDSSGTENDSLSFLD